MPIITITGNIKFHFAHNDITTLDSNTNWVKTEDELPVYSQPVIAKVKGWGWPKLYYFSRSAITLRGRFKLSCSSNRELDIKKITHWMYLPELPK